MAGYSMDGGERKSKKRTYMKWQVVHDRYRKENNKERKRRKRKDKARNK
jgi:hypothetical protein